MTHLGIPRLALPSARRWPTCWRSVSTRASSARRRSRGVWTNGGLSSRPADPSEVFGRDAPVQTILRTGRNTRMGRAGRSVRACVTTSRMGWPSGGGRRRGGGSPRSSSRTVARRTRRARGASGHRPLAAHAGRGGHRRAAGGSRSRRHVALESRRITGHLNRTIDRLIDTEAELRLLLDDLPEAVMSVDDGGVVRGANAKTAELSGRRSACSSGAADHARRDRPQRRAGRLVGGRSARRPGRTDLAAAVACATTDADGRRSERRPAAQDRWCSDRPHARQQQAEDQLHSSKPAAGSSRCSTRRPGWPSSASTTRRSSTPTARWPTCCRAGDRPRRPLDPRAHASRGPARRPPTGPGSSWASPTRTCSTSGTCRDG